jgi:hypothetical protein
VPIEAIGSPILKNPRVLPGLAADWLPTGVWTPEYLRSAVGREGVPIERYPTGWEISAPEQTIMTVSDYLDALSDTDSDERLYLADLPLAAYLPQLVSELPLQEMPVRDLRLLSFAGSNTVSALHFHTARHVALCQLVGYKSVLILEPRAVSQMGFHRATARLFNFAVANFGGIAEVLEAARVAGVSAEVFSLEPGDALLIPVYWPHFVQGRDWSFSVSLAWRASLASHLAVPSMALRSLVGRWCRSR